MSARLDRIEKMLEIMAINGEKFSNDIGKLEKENDRRAEENEKDKEVMKEDTKALKKMMD
jgi:hypothetical protein